MSEKPRQTRTREQDKDEDKDEEETGVLLKELKVIQSKMDNIEKQLNSEVDGLYGSMEKILKSELKKCVKEIHNNIDLEIGALKSHLDLLEQNLGWRLIINQSKTQIIHFRKKAPQQVIKILPLGR